MVGNELFFWCKNKIQQESVCLIIQVNFKRPKSKALLEKGFRSASSFTFVKTLTLVLP
jgi:hypothetical protein